MKVRKECEIMLRKNECLKKRYRIERVIGQGGSSIVYDVYDEVLKKHWALKQLKGAMGQTKEQLWAEIELQKNLNHRSLARIVDMIEENNTYYLVMDLIEGDSLETILKYVKKFSEYDAVNYALELCDILAYIHAKGIIFRDLKPSNIMRTKEGHLMLIDFGIARIYKEDHQCDTTAIGTKGYAAPEQYANRIYQKRVQSDARSDIYALGATLYHFLTGEKPLLIGDLCLREHDMTLSEGLHEIIYKCTRIYQKDRYQSIEEVKYHLLHYQSLTKQHKRIFRKRICICASFFILSISMFIISHQFAIKDYYLQEQKIQAALMKVETRQSDSILQKHYDETILVYYQDLIMKYPTKIYLYQSLMDYCHYFGMGNQGLKMITNIVNSHPKALKNNEILCYLGELYFYGGLSMDDNMVDYAQAYVYFSKAHNEISQYYTKFCQLFMNASEEVYPLVQAFIAYNESQPMNEQSLRNTLFITYAILQQSTFLQAEGYQPYDLALSQIQKGQKTLKLLQKPKLVERYQKTVQLQQSEIAIAQAYQVKKPKYYQQAIHSINEYLQYCVSEEEEHEWLFKMADLHLYYDKEEKALQIYQELDQQGDVLATIHYSLYALSSGDMNQAMKLYQKIKDDPKVLSMTQFQLLKEKLAYGKIVEGKAYE